MSITHKTASGHEQHEGLAQECRICGLPLSKEDDCSHLRAALVAAEERAAKAEVERDELLERWLETEIELAALEGVAQHWIERFKVLDPKLAKAARAAIKPARARK
jgi:hypothetical protein